MESFTEFFYSTYCHNEMSLIRDNDSHYWISPTSQLDWMYDITMISNTKWFVKGNKDDYLSQYYCGPEVIEYTFEWKDNYWNLIDN